MAADGSGGWWSRLRPYGPAVAIGLVFSWSVLAIATYRQEEAPAGTRVTLRLGHWQLENGVREGMDNLIAAYRVLHPEVNIVQDPVPESTYGTWLTTQLMGGTAPDMLEMGMVSYQVMLGYYSRYALPLSPWVGQPNPYNAGTELEGVPWRQTFKDGMRGAYLSELQEYMNVPLSQFGVRIFYNRDLLLRLTGRAQAPTDYREFLAVCDTIGRQRNGRGEPYVPIASSAYHVSMWQVLMIDPLTYGAFRIADFNRDGSVGVDEFYVALMTGRLSLDYPGYAAWFAMLRQLSRRFQPGWTGLGRDEAVFLFAQQRAVFITTGTWDAGSLRDQAAGAFELGIMDFPLPGRDDPEFGPVVEGPVYERPEGGFPFAVIRTCRHPEVAVDFLRFATSQRQNEQLNQTVGWIPSVRGARMPAALTGFQPHLEGVYGAMAMAPGGNTAIKWTQLVSLFSIEQIDFGDLARDYGAYYRRYAPEEFAEIGRNARRAMASDEQLLAVLRRRAQTAPPEQQAGLWAKYRILTTDRLILRDLPQDRLRRILAAGTAIGDVAPYALRPQALANARRLALAAAPTGALP
jgi:raffinose/stachyose/melibiose transport system substrate-binding protein